MTNEGRYYLQNGNSICEYKSFGSIKLDILYKDFTAFMRVSEYDLLGTSGGNIFLLFVGQILDILSLEGGLIGIFSLNSIPASISNRRQSTSNNILSDESIHV